MSRNGGWIMEPFADVQDFFSIYRLYSAFSRTLDETYCYAGQRHDFWELVIVTDGQACVTAGADIFRLKKGQAVIHEPMEFHRIWTEGPEEVGILIFTFSSHSVPAYSGKVFLHADIHAAEAVLKQLQSNFLTRGSLIDGITPNRGIQPQIALKALETFVLQLLSEQSNAPSLSSRSAINYATIVKVMEEHIHENLSIPDIARLSNLGEANVKLTFSQYAGVGVMQYFNRLKVARSIELIQNGAAIKEVAAALGFSDQNYFSTVFKRITGKSPSSYKPDK